jgi:hypothetical protein
MSRKVKMVTVAAQGRDAGKVFKLTEMSAAQAEEWALRLFLGLAKSGIEVPDDIASSGLAGIATLGVKAIAGLRWEDAKPLLDEMFLCIQAVPDPMRPEIVRYLVDSDTEEISTRMMLRKEVFDLHTGFFTGASPLSSEMTSTAGAGVS